MCKEDNFLSQIVFPFIKLGIKRGYARAYFASERKLDADGKALRKYGLDVNSLPEITLTVLSSKNWYLKKGKTESKTMKANLKKLVQKKYAGFAVLIYSGETGVLFEKGNGEEYIKYEESLGRQLSSDRYTLDLYNNSILKENLFNRISKSRPNICQRHL